MLLAWLVAFVGGITAGVQVFPRLDTDYSGSSIESFAGYDHLEESADFGSRISALIDRPDDPPGQQVLTGALADLRATDGVARAVDPLTAPAEAGLVSPDGTKALVVVDLAKDLDGAPFDGWLRRVHDRIGLREHVEPPPIEPAASEPVEAVR